MAAEIKIYLVSGTFVRNHRKFTFNKYIRAVSEQNAVTKVLDIISSQRIKRRKIKITEVKTVAPEECDDLYIKELTEMK